ncbi:MAG: hypothetical protein BWX44_01601 [Spirochaetes bacterium ADurb.Bin001]|nr:MAG: hypothetical protein BWX44_01601 [Spirochaetes bacterium ADurb.Bin001]
MNPEKGVFLIASQRFVKVDIVLIGELRLGTAPESAGAIDLFIYDFGFGLCGILCIGLFLGDKVNWPGDVIRISLEKFFESPAGEKLFSFLIDMYNDICPKTSSYGWFYIETGLAIALPDKSLIGTCLEADYFDLICNHKGRIETNSKLPDQIRYFALIFRELFQKGSRAGASDSS